MIHRLDQILLKKALRDKSFMVLDCTFPDTVVPEFAYTHEDRFVHAPLQSTFAPGLAAGLATLERTVLVFGCAQEFTLPDANLNVKQVLESLEGSWDSFEQKLSEFGQGVLLIPLNE